MSLRKIYKFLWNLLELKVTGEEFAHILSVFDATTLSASDNTAQVAVCGLLAYA